MLDIENITITNGQQKSIEKINFTLKNGECLLIDGDSGSGKTLLFSSCVGVQRPINGDVLVDSTSLYYSDFIDLALSRRKLGVIFQRPAIISNLTVFENVRLASETHLSSLSKKEKLDLVNNELETFDLYSYKDSRPSDLSVGQLFHLSFVRAKICDPDIFVWDSPLQNIAKKYKNYIYDFITKKKQNGASILLFGNGNNVFEEIIDEKLYLRENGLNDVS